MARLHKTACGFSAALVQAHSSDTGSCAKKPAYKDMSMVDKAINIQKSKLATIQRGQPSVRHPVRSCAWGSLRLLKDRVEHRPQQLASNARKQSLSLWSGCAMQASPRRRYAMARRPVNTASSPASFPAAVAIFADSCSTAAWASALACTKEPQKFMARMGSSLN